jgi:hypothetical protein
MFSSTPPVSDLLHELSSALSITVNLLYLAEVSFPDFEMQCSAAANKMEIFQSKGFGDGTS